MTSGRTSLTRSTREPSGVNAAARPKLLIVDDRPENLFAMKHALGGLDVEVMTAESGEDALALMLRHVFAVVLLDVQMPGMDGFETAALMREHEETRKTPIIFVTAINKEERYIFRGYEAGAVDYLFKPVDPKILEGKVTVFLELFRQREELARALAELERANDDLDSFAYALRGLVDTGRARERVEAGAAGAVADVDGDDDEREHESRQRLMNPEEMARRLSQFLSGRATDSVTDSVTDSTTGSTTGSATDSATGSATGSATATTRVRFFDESYEFAGPRAPVIDVLVASMEDVVTLGRHLEQVHEELRHEIEERRRAEQASLAASQAKSRFLANMSHELRTPLNAIIGLSELILSDEGRGRFDSGVGDDVRLINDSGIFLLELIDSLMVRSRIEMDQMALDIEPVDVFELARSVSATMAPVAQRGQNTLRFVCDDDIGVLDTDRVKLRQILHNLITNACKFTRGGDICLRICRELSAGVESFVFQVSDTGMGIDPAQHGEIFEDFKQLDSSSTRQHSGVGLGLAICRHYCELMGASITVDSALGKGSVFTVRVPMASTARELMATRQ